MKKVIMLILISIFCITLVGCENSNNIKFTDDTEQINEYLKNIKEFKISLNNSSDNYSYNSFISNVTNKQYIVNEKGTIELVNKEVLDVTSNSGSKALFDLKYDIKKYDKLNKVISSENNHLFFEDNKAYQANNDEKIELEESTLILKYAYIISKALPIETIDDVNILLHSDKICNNLTKLEISESTVTYYAEFPYDDKEYEIKVIFDKNNNEFIEYTNKYSSFDELGNRKVDEINYIFDISK